MRERAGFYRREIVFTLWALSSAGLATLSCGPGVGGIQSESDASGAGGRAGADGGRDGSTGGLGGVSADGSGGVADGAAEGAGGSPVCLFHTDPPSPFAPQMESGSDVPAPTSDASDGALDDASNPDASNPDVIVDAQPSDATTADGGGATDAVGDRVAREGGAAGDAGPATSITVETSPFLGRYLADSTGRTLYTFGNDQPGDCKNMPNTDCVADCLTAWPAFDAGKRTLPSTLSDTAFGSITRADGVTFTTYYGWPLYYYRPDTGKGVINGHGKSRTWHVATVLPAGTVIMRKGTEARYVADGTGRTLYAFDQDTLGTSTESPVSACSGTCLDSYLPYEKKSISVVSSLEITDFTLFVRPDTRTQQVAYKGAPLYLAVADSRSGTQNGLAMGWSLVAAP
jgi:predicted lipoprotein with Yx(FWY)xxD motif